MPVVGTLISKTFGIKTAGVSKWQDFFYFWKLPYSKKELHAGKIGSGNYFGHVMEYMTWICFSELISLETSLSCTAADVKKIAPGWENCVEIVRRTLPAWVPGGSEKLCKNCARTPFFA